ncbi:DNA damage-inducible protein [Methylophaga thalassica]|uniref:DNA damage-inducible protein n=1 Tax=Methylophaga thalassica TaxID=40223 RepID=A0ABQ5TWN8_9GAMM|nr:type ISP restriction/modification enzyme [Methylophaga thalassica]GLQ00608.1 DNA damage-inducible protein [Methylophaga thalassica]
MPSVLSQILASFREKALSERDKGTDFEHLSLVYLRNEPYYRDLYREVMTYGDWAEQNGLTKKDTGIDLVGVTHQDEIHAIQCKNYAADYKITKADIDSFFTASGKTIFSNRIIITTAKNWTQNASDALEGQHPPVSTITLADLENSLIDWSQFQVQKVPVLRPKKTLREHQENALKATKAGLQAADRGKLIMACGTGKTFTSLKIAETMAGKGKTVLFLVPSLSLLSQTLTEWTQESETPLHSFAVCSDSDVGKTRNLDDDSIQATVSDLQYPATTNPKSLAGAFAARHDAEHMSVIYATYHSIAVIHDAQKLYGLPEIDLIVCDEAHRTTGATFDGDEESAFVRVHDNDYIRAQKRLYMTATPRIYGEKAKEASGVELFSMDNQQHYGKELYVINFSEAVSRGLLVDYKVVVLAVEEGHINRRMQEMLKSDDNELKVDDAAKIIGCWKALSKQGLTIDGDSQPMQRAVAFCQVIEKEYKGKNHKVSSKLISEMFGAVVDEYQRLEIEELRAEDPDAEIDTALTLTCEAEHVDGSMNASEKEAKLEWLKEDTPENTCRILSNVRCLSEGVDVPSLDAVLFLTPRSSQVDVVQSVGRVMRLSPGKKQGYVILPVVIPAGVEPSQALDDNKTYKVVWQVLNALRSHDDRFDAMINKLEFNGKDSRKMEVISVADKVQRRSKAATGKGKSAGKAKGGSAIGSGSNAPVPEQASLQFEVGEIERALYAQVVKKCGNRHHWEDWANDIAKIANTHIDRIQAILENKDNTAEIAAFEAFAQELRDDLNNAVTDVEIIEMLAQHLITKPVFDALFEGYNFTEHNPMSVAMQAVTEQLEAHNIDKEADTLRSFYESVKMRAAGIESAEGKQRIIVELYDKFFKNAFPRMTDRLGIVYTPVEVVDFIIHSIEDVLKAEFGKSMADENVHLLDGFTGTGTFPVRLLQSGIIPKNKLEHKYKHEIHANELVLLAYYIAAINIEATYHGIMNDNVTGLEESDQIFEVPYEPFTGICLTDTFQMYESEDMVDALLVENSSRRKRQKELDIRVIMGNPPYSIGQASENDNNANVSYPKLDERIRSTYAARSTATLAKGLYDSYIRAIRWASDRIGDAGVIGFVTNGGFLEANTADGLRKCLAEEFSSIHVFHLRGNARTSGELRRKEKDNVFGMGTRTPIVVSILVKNPEATEHGRILFHDIGDYLNRTEKLEMIADYASLNGIPSWQLITPDQHGDWLNQRDDSFNEHIVLGDKKSDEPKLFENFSLGVVSNRDAWVYNFCKQSMTANMSGMIEFYGSELDRFNAEYQSLSNQERSRLVDGFINTDPTKISWTHNIKQDFARNKSLGYEHSSLTTSLYRPFTKQWMYYNRAFNERVYQMPRIFPLGSGVENLVIQFNANYSGTGLPVLIANSLPDLHCNGDSQCFPLYLYDEQAQEKAEDANGDLFGDNKQQEPGLKRRDAITDEGLAHFQEAYPSEQIIKEDLFYYVYGILHSEDYRTRFADNLSKELPRIPKVKKAADFWAFSKAGRDLAELHLNYETVDKYPVTIQAKGNLVDEDYRVTKMKFGKKRCEETGKNIDDRSTVIYNGKITMTGIPGEAWDYVVNGKAALAWVMERQAVTTHKASGIVNDANDWAIETMGNAKYPLELFQRVVTVSLETQKIVSSLPELDMV